MGHKEFRRSMAVFPIGTMMQLTDLTARQIRYYEEQRLIQPVRTETNRRMYSLNDVDRLLEIKDFLEEGWTIAAISKHYETPNSTTAAQAQGTPQLTDEDVRRILYDETMHLSRLGGTNQC